MNKIKIIPEIDALLLVDVQNDFLPGGALGVADGDKILPIVHRLIAWFKFLFASMDWHPEGHVSNAHSYIDRNVHANQTFLTEDMVQEWENRKLHLAALAQFELDELSWYVRKVGGQMVWNTHCLQRSFGAQLHDSLANVQFRFVQRKGYKPCLDAYSAFADVMRNKYQLEDELHKVGIKRVFVVGLAFDYCVGRTAIDSAKAGFQTYVIEDATRSVGLPEGSAEKMRQELVEAGVRIIQSTDLEV